MPIQIRKNPPVHNKEPILVFVSTPPYYNNANSKQPNNHIQKMPNNKCGTFVKGQNMKLYRYVTRKLMP